MTIKQLKEHLKNFDENLEIGGIGHLGEILEIENVSKSNLGFIALEIESAGESNN
jgi:hypothetical protein